MPTSRKNGKVQVMNLDRPQKLFCFGFGYTAAALAAQLDPAAWSLAGTRRHPATAPGVVAFDGARRESVVATALRDTTHVLLSIPPTAEGDPALHHHAADIAALPSLRWIGYLSTIGVYGDTGGAWVDETGAVQPHSDRGERRARAEEAWRDFGRSTGKRVEIFRLPGIYGPGRSAIDQLRAGTARRIIKPGQVFNRIHVADIAAALACAMALASDRSHLPFDTFNLVDDEPAPPQDVIAFAAILLGVPIPPDQPFDTASLSPMARSFYAESKRVSNARMKQVLGVSLRYPTYREGMRAIIANQ